MTRPFTLLHTAAAAALALSALPAGAETLRPITNWNSSFDSSAFTIAWAGSFNDSPAARAADIRIQFVGGPEVAPATERMTALSNGVVDMLFGSACWYVGELPEASALHGSPRAPMEARARGGIALTEAVIAFSPVACAHHAALAAEEQARIEAQGTRPFRLPPGADTRFVVPSAALHRALVQQRAPERRNRLRAAFGADRAHARPAAPTTLRWRRLRLPPGP